MKLSAQSILKKPKVFNTSMLMWDSACWPGSSIVHCLTWSPLGGLQWQVCVSACSGSEKGSLMSSKGTQPDSDQLAIQSHWLPFKPERPGLCAAWLHTLHLPTFAWRASWSVDNLGSPPVHFKWSWFIPNRDWIHLTCPQTRQSQLHKYHQSWYLLPYFRQHCYFFKWLPLSFKPPTFICIMFPHLVVWILKSDLSWDFLHRSQHPSTKHSTMVSAVHRQTHGPWKVRHILIV